MTDEKAVDFNALQDRIVEMAKDLLILDGLVDLLHGLDNPDHVHCAIPIRFASPAKTAAFHTLVVALKAAKAAAEDFRVAHVAAEKDNIRATMERDLQEEMRRVDGLERDDIERRRAS